jgi:hypothetical protein
MNIPLKKHQGGYMAIHDHDPENTLSPLAW